MSLPPPPPGFAEFMRPRTTSLEKLERDVAALKAALEVLMRDAKAACDTVELEPALFQARAAIDAVRMP